MSVFGVCRKATKNALVSARTFGGISTRPKTEKRRHGADFAPTRHCASNQPRQGTVGDPSLAPIGRGHDRFSRTH